MKNDLVAPQSANPNTIAVNLPATPNRWDPFTIKWTLWLLAATALVGVAVAYPDLLPLLLPIAERMPR